MNRQVSKYKKENFTENGTAVVTASGTNQIVIQVHNLCDFRLEHMYFITTGACDIQIEDGGASKTLSKDYVDVNMYNGIIGGSAIGNNTGYKLPHAYTFRSKSDIIIKVRDTSGASNTVKAYLNGCRLYSN